MESETCDNGYKIHKRPASLRHNRTASDLPSSFERDHENNFSSSEISPSNGLRAVNTVTGAIQNFFKWSTPLAKEKKARSFDSLETAAGIIHDNQRYLGSTGSTESVAMDKRRSSGGLVLKTPPPSREVTPKEGSPDLNSGASNCESAGSRKGSFNSPGKDGSDGATGGSSAGFGSPRKSTDSSDSQKGTDPHMDLREKSFEKSLNNILNKCSDLNIDSKTDDGKSGKADRKKKSTPWYTMLSPTYKSRSEDFKRQFKEIPADERLIVDYSCALQKEILVHGRMFVTQNWICFYANIFRWETVVTIPTKEILAITKEKTARVIPNAIQITTDKEKCFFTSFTARDKTFMMLFRLWQNALMEQPMSPQELWHWVHSSYGDELGLTSSDDDYVPPPSVSESKDMNKDSSIVSKGDSSDVLLTSDLQHGHEDDSLLQEQSGAVPLVLQSHEDETQTDESDTTEDGVSEGEVVCTVHDHFNQLGHNEIYMMPVDKLFELIFTDTEFFRSFTAARKLQDVTMTPWRDDPDENIGRVRDLSYTLPINAPFGPKTSHTQEKHMCYKQSQPGVLYVIDAECQPMGIPYSDAFYVVNRYCLTRVSKDRCRLRVTSEVKYRKSVWGVVRNMIERNTMQGVLDYFQTLGIHLKRETDKQEKPGHAVATKRKLRKRRTHGKMLRSGGAAGDKSSVRQLGHGGAAEKMVAPPTPVRNMIAAQKEEKLLKMNAQTLVRIVCFILVLLVMFNALLFYKLWSLESMADVLYLRNSQASPDTLAGRTPQSKDEWLELLQRQQQLHESEMEKWRKMIGGSIVLVDQMRSALLNLQDHMDNKQYSSAHYDSSSKDSKKYNTEDL